MRLPSQIVILLVFLNHRVRSKQDRSQMWVETNDYCDGESCPDKKASDDEEHGKYSFEANRRSKNTFPTVDDEPEDYFSDLHFFDENMDEATASEINECMLYTVFNSKYSMGVEYFWKTDKNSSLIRHFLSGKETLLHIDIRDYTNYNALKFTSINFVMKTKHKNRQRELDEILKTLEIKMIHLGNSHFHCDGKYYVKISDSLEFRHSFAKNANGEHVVRNGVFDKVQKGIYFVSPYSTWKLQLFSSDQKKSVVGLTKFSEEIDLVLEGEGQFLSEECLHLCDGLLGVGCIDSFSNFQSDGRCVGCYILDACALGV